MHKKYASAYANRQYDAIVIGSGIGGLTTASIMSRAGKKVLVLERHYTPGGFTHVFKRRRYAWDVGLHYMGNFEENELMRNIFDYITAKPIQWEAMGDLYDVIVVEGKKYEFVKGREALIEKLCGYFPAEKEAILTYFRLVKKVNDWSALFFSERFLPGWLGYFFSNMMRTKFLKYARQTTYEVLSSLTSDKQLIAVLCGQCGNYGLTPKKSSFAIHALIVGHYIEGGGFPVGGASVIYESILPVIEKSGGDVLVNAEVESILIEDQKATGVRMKNGDVLRAPVIISNAGVHNTYGRMISDTQYIPAEIREDMEKIRPSISHFALYVGLNETDEKLRLPKHNFWIYNNADFDEALEKYLKDPLSQPPLSYISFPSAKDPEWKNAYPGRSTIQVIAPASYEYMKQWEGTQWMKRGSSYDQYKEQVKQHLLGSLLKELPHIKDHIEVCELSTPLSTQHFTNYSKGEIYGLEHSPERFRARWLRPETPIKNLYLTGQDIMTVGVTSALFSGVLTATVILKKNLYFKIRKASGQAQKA